MNKVIRNKQILIDEDTCWKLRGDEVPGGDEGINERLSFQVKGERLSLVPGEEIKLSDDRGKLVTFSCLW